MPPNKEAAHECDWSDIAWDRKPDYTESASRIEWHGTCKCGARVIEIYRSEGLFDENGNMLQEP